MLLGIECRTDVVNEIDVKAAQIEYQQDERQIDRMGYDQLVLACGADSNLAMITGIA
jgi:NADH dehydrogenase FAD-containing subunit